MKNGRAKEAKPGGASLGVEKVSEGATLHPHGNPSRKRAPKVEIRHEGRVCSMYGDKERTLDAAFGTTEPEFTRVVIEQLVNVMNPDPDKPIPEDVVNAAIAAVHGMGPTTELEALLASQMYAAHLLSMRCAQHAVSVGQSEQGREFNLRQSVKLMGTFTRQVEAYQKLRTGAQQRVSVEHIHIHQGAQAIVGQVNSRAQRMGDAGEIAGTTP